MLYLLQQLANAVPLSALYAALAFGYALSFGLLRRADLAYGALFAFGGQVCVLFAGFGWTAGRLVLPAALALGAAAGLAYAGGAGLVIGRYVMQPLARRRPHALIVAALGLSIVLMETARLASGSRELWLSPFLNRPVVFAEAGGYRVTLTVLQLANSAAFALAIAGGLLVLGRSRLGRAWRAVADDPGAAALVGVDAGRVLLASYALSALVAGGCGVLAVFHYGTMDFGSGLMFGLKVLVLAAVGGAGRPGRAAAGAAAYGLAETLWGAYAPFLWRDAVMFAALVLLLVLSRQERPIP